MICPITTEQITKDHKDRDELISQWQTIFCIASGIHFFGVIFYAVFASGELQDWAKGAPEAEEKMEMNQDLEQSHRGANLNVVTEAPPSYDEVNQPLQHEHQQPQQPSANPFTSAQNNPFRQWKEWKLFGEWRNYLQQWNIETRVNGVKRNKEMDLLPNNFLLVEYFLYE